MFCCTASARHALRGAGTRAAWTWSHSTVARSSSAFAPALASPALASPALAPVSSIPVKTPIVNLLGDEMAQVMWDWITKRLVLPYVDVALQTVDLSLENRKRTDDRVTSEAAALIRDAKVAVKCATITPDEARVAEFGLPRMYRSPNGTIRNLLDGTVFRTPIMISTIPRALAGWVRPITIARHAHGDQYRATDFVVPGAGELRVSFAPASGGAPIQHIVHTFTDQDAGGVALAMYNTQRSVARFARACLQYALDAGQPLYLSTKNTILKAYDRIWMDAFSSCYDAEFRAAYEARGITYEHRLIDDMVAMAIKSAGGFVWACKNYDGDVQSDMVAQAGGGSLALMTSELHTPDGICVSEAAHGTVTRHFRQWQQGAQTSTNPTASVFAWTRGLHHAARLEDNPRLGAFSAALEAACVATIESGTVTKDLALLQPEDRRPAWVDTESFLAAVRTRLDAALAKSAADTAADTGLALGAGLGTLL